MHLANLYSGQCDQLSLGIRHQTICTCCLSTKFLLASSPQIVWSIPFSSSNRSKTRRCVTSISSAGKPASHREWISLKKPALRSVAKSGSEDGSSKFVDGLAWSAGRMLECQSQHVPIRSNTMAFKLGIEGNGSGIMCILGMAIFKIYRTAYGTFRRIMLTFKV